MQTNAKNDESVGKIGHVLEITEGRSEGKINIIGVINNGSMRVS